jgi:hypothetical protein
VRLSSHQAAYHLGREETRIEIEKMARSGNPFAIILLGSMAGSEDMLCALAESANIHIRFNAVLALLERKDPRCLASLYEFLINDSRGLACVEVSSPGKTLHAYKVIPSAEQKKELENSREQLEELRQIILIKASALPEKDFLNLSSQLLEEQQNDLIPVLIEVLQNVQTPAAIDLLKYYQHKAGAPLIRQYCTLALYRMKEEGPYVEQLFAWIKQQRGEELIRFKPLTVDETRLGETSYHLSPQETSQLLIQAYEAVADSQEERAVDVLLEAIKNGNKKNKYALAGLLMRAAQ